MPIYSYKCRKCERVFDSFQRVDENSNIKCVYCGSEAQRIFSPVGIILKGSGFYTTDYGSKYKKTGSNTGTSGDNLKETKKPEIKSSDKETPDNAVDKKEKGT